MVGRRCATVIGALATIDSVEELDAFAEMMRNPPTGIETKKPTEQEWQIIARRKIELQQRAISDGA